MKIQTSNKLQQYKKIAQEVQQVLKPYLNKKVITKDNKLIKKLQDKIYQIETKYDNFLISISKYSISLVFIDSTYLTVAELSNQTLTKLTDLDKELQLILCEQKLKEKLKTT